MNNNGNGVKPIRDPRSKSQLLQDLSKTQDRLDKKEIELARCTQELHGTQTELTASEALKANLQTKEQELGKALSKTKKLESLLKELRNKSESLERQNKNLKQESKSQGQEKGLFVAEKQRLAESRIEEMESQAKELKQKMKALESQNKKLQQEKDGLAEQKESYSKLAESHKKIEALTAQNLSLNQQVGKLNSQIKMLKQVTEALKTDADKQQDTLPAQPALEAHIPFESASRDDPQSTKRVSRQRHVEKQYISQALQEIRFRQQNEKLEPGQPLRPWEPFAVCTQLQLTATPTQDNLEADSTKYSIQIAAKESATNEVIVVESVVGELKSSQSAYENVIEMPKFSPGKYELEVVAIAPAVRIGEQKKMEFLVKF